MINRDIVFIDTSVFIAENYFSPGNRIHALFKLAKAGKIRIVMPEITRREIHKHIRSAIRESWKVFNQQCKVLRNNSDIDTWRINTTEKKEVDKIISMFEKLIEESFSIKLNFSYCSNSEKVFNAFFEGQKPFGEGAKKDEFPDAFVLTSLEKYSSEINRQITVLSCDGDMNCYTSSQLVHEDYKQFVSRKLAEGVFLEEMVKRLQDEKEFLEERIRDESKEFLSDYRLYEAGFNLQDVSYFSVNMVSVDLNEDRYEVTNITDYFIEIEIQPTFSFLVDIEYVNYDFAVYDKEDGKWYGTEEESFSVDSSANVRVTLQYYLSKTKENDNLEIKDIDLLPIIDAIK